MTKNLPESFLVFDIESVGLHGEAFAYGAVIVELPSWREVRGVLAWCSPRLARGTAEDLEWVEKNCALDTYRTYPLKSPKEVRDSFWSLWRGVFNWPTWLAADVAWPVEANFLRACVGDDLSARVWEGPYPLVDVASVRLAAGLDPLATVEREEDELPAHNPLADARQSARLLAEAFSKTLHSDA